MFEYRNQGYCSISLPVGEIRVQVVMEGDAIVSYKSIYWNNCHPIVLCIKYFLFINLIKIMDPFFGKMKIVFEE